MVKPVSMWPIVVSWDNNMVVMVVMFVFVEMVFMNMVGFMSQN
mgnify:CR=1 FL=1